jgi:hypothetical protein
MSIVSEQDVSDALEILANEEGAAWRGTHNYLDALTKTVIAKLMGESNEKTSTAQEAAARRHPDFIDHLKRLKEADSQDHRWRQRYAAAEAKIEIWRTINANQRAAERVR